MQAALEKILPEVVALRHELHQHPELRFEETWTSDRIAAYLTEHGIPHTRGHARGTGIVAEIPGASPRCLVLRADIDALEIDEETGLPYASKRPGFMHACGHDGHSACLCGTARALWELRGALPGTVRCIFQPAEEQAAGGRLIVEEGLLEGAEAVFALHGWPTLRTGAASVASGPVMASADCFKIHVKGSGGHAANPGATIDPVYVAAQIVNALQSVVSREQDPWDPAVITIGRIESGRAPTIIPDTALLEGTYRALTPATRVRLAEAIERIAVHTAAAHRAEARVVFADDGYPPLRNDPGRAAFVSKCIEASLGADALVPVGHPYLYAEDFAYYLDAVRGAFIFLGTGGRDPASKAQLHSNRYDFDDGALRHGMALFTRIATDYFGDAG